MTRRRIDLRWTVTAEMHGEVVAVPVEAWASAFNWRHVVFMPIGDEMFLRVVATVDGERWVEFRIENSDGQLFVRDDDRDPASLGRALLAKTASLPSAVIIDLARRLARMKLRRARSLAEVAEADHGARGERSYLDQLKQQVQAAELELADLDRQPTSRPPGPTADQP